MLTNASVDIARARTDLMRESGNDYLVIGFFTPDYYALAAELAENLDLFSISYHLYATDKQQGQWGHQTLRKPSVLKQARLDHPTRPLIFMDVDCSVRGDLTTMLTVEGDIAVPMGRKAMKNGTALKPGTRVILVRPTAMSDRFLDAWEQKCQMNLNPVGNDEIRLQMAIEDSAGQFAIAVLPRPFTGMEIRKASAADMIVHDSARDEARFLGRFQKSLKHHFRVWRNLVYRRLFGRDYKSVGSR